MSQLSETLLTLLNTFSITGTEGPLQWMFEERILKQIKGCKSHVTFKKHLQSLVVFVEPPKIQRSELIVILGHTDTVPGEKIPARIDGDHVIGLGASDMKGGLALMLELLRAPHIDNFISPVAFVFYAGEEGPTVGNELSEVMAAFPRLKEAKLAIFAEPTDRTIQLGCLGLVNVKVKFHGKAAHSARPWNGVNAIHRAGNFLTALNNMQPKSVRIGAVEYFEVSTVTLAHGGTASNVIPGVFELNLNIRLAPGTDPEKRIAQLQELAGSEATFEVYDRAPAGRVPLNNPVYDRFLTMVAAPQAPKQAYTDVGLLSQLGIDAINFGPGLTSQCHVAGEYIKMSDLEWGFDKYLTFLCS